MVRTFVVHHTSMSMRPCRARTSRTEAATLSSEPQVQALCDDSVELLRGGVTLAALGAALKLLRTSCRRAHEGDSCWLVGSRGKVGGALVAGRSNLFSAVPVPSWSITRFSMEMFFKRKAPEHDHVNNSRCIPEINFEEEIKYDPGLRKEIDTYHPNQREKLRRKYLGNEPCQPRTCIFLLHKLEKKKTQEGLFLNGSMSLVVGRFIPEWFDEFSSWLEYSESKDRAYCFCYFLFREKKDAGYKAFVVDGWNGYHRKNRLKLHVGDVGGLHYNAMKKCDDLLQRDQHIDVAFNKLSNAAKNAYFT